MNKLILCALLCSTLNFYGQSRKAALTFLNSSRPEVTFYEMKPPRQPDTPRVFFKNGLQYNDTITYNILKKKVKDILPQLSFRLIPEDSVITTANYKKIVSDNVLAKESNDRTAEGYVYPSYTPFGGINYAKSYFESEPIPDIVIEAKSYFELNNAYGKKYAGANGYSSNIVCVTTIKGFNIKGKKLFKLDARYTNPTNVKLRPSAFSGWGSEIDEDISIYQKEALMECLKLIDLELPKQIDKVNNYYK